MRDEILSYTDMAFREGLSLQKGMNFHVRPGYSILLMSTRDNAPYHDRWDEDRDALLYQGHDAPRRHDEPDPKSIDQPLTYPSGSLTQNGKFFEAAKRAAHGESPAEVVRVYEKLHRGIWSDKGLFELVDARIELENGRNVCVFMLHPRPDADEQSANRAPAELSHRRMIPTHVKVEVWDRDRGKCVKCGATTNLHFDHDVPFSKGGSSLTAANVRLLCAKHNLAKSDRIE